jgi:antitoxin VapB
MQPAKLFQTGQSQAVRLPKDFRFDGSEVFIKKTHNSVVLIPKDNPWESFFRGLEGFTDDYMSEREQPRHQEREGL